MNLGPIEKIAIAFVVGAGAWHLGAPAMRALAPGAHSTSRSPASIAPASSSARAADAQSEESVKFPTVGMAMFSREGDPCHVTKSYQTDHPPGYRPGTFTSEVQLYCDGAHGKYVLNNKGVYRNGVLVSSSRKRIDDGGCFPLVLHKRLGRSQSKPKEKLVALSAVFRCMKMGQPVMEQIVGIYDQSGKPIWGQARRNTEAEVRASLAQGDRMLAASGPARPSGTKPGVRR